MSTALEESVLDGPAIRQSLAPSKRPSDVTEEEAHAARERIAKDAWELMCMDGCGALPGRPLDKPTLVRRILFRLTPRRLRMRRTQ